MKDKINTFKDYILKLSYEGKDIDESNMTPEDKKAWKYYIEELASDGYIRLIPVCGVPWFSITPKGTIFLINGGFSKNRQKTSINTDKYFDMFIEVLVKEGISSLFNGLLK